jgi:hypothetical protein
VALAERLATGPIGPHAAADHAGAPDVTPRRGPVRFDHPDERLRT